MYRPTILITAPVATRSGYGARSRDVTRALIALDSFDIKIFPVPWGTTSQNALTADDPNDTEIISRIVTTQEELPKSPDIHIHIVVPNEFLPLGKYNIGITAGLEASVIPQDWIIGINKMDLVLCSSTFSRDVMKSTEYTNKETGEVLKIVKKVDVLFEGVDTNIYKKLSGSQMISKELKDAMESVKENWNFLFVGHWLSGGIGEDRKDVGNLVKTFFTTFKGKKNTGLILKTSGATTCKIDREQILAKVKQAREQVGNEKSLPNVYVLHADLYDDEMNQLYNHPKVKANITFTHGEGFGRPLLEASISEKPIIASNWSGHTDFLNKHHTALLPGGLIEVPESALPKNIWLAEQRWFGVNYGAASTAMKRMRSNVRPWKLKAKKQAMYNRSHFSFKAMTKRIESLLAKNLPKFTETVDVKLPEVPKINLPKLEKV
jgi:glycosyltransferase involved in cell wall biosynthesis